MSLSVFYQCFYWLVLKLFLSRTDVPTTQAIRCRWTTQAWLNLPNWCRYCKHSCCENLVKHWSDWYLGSQITTSMLPYSVHTYLACRLESCWSFFLLVVVVYDWLLTLSDEIRLVWKRKLTGATVLFLLNRYTTLIMYVIPILADHLKGNTTKVNVPVRYLHEDWLKESQRFASILSRCVQ